MTGWSRLSESFPSEDDNVIVFTSSCSESNCVFKNGEFWISDTVIPSSMIVYWKKISNKNDFSDIPTQKCRMCGGI